MILMKHLHFGIIAKHETVALGVLLLLWGFFIWFCLVSWLGFFCVCSALVSKASCLMVKMNEKKKKKENKRNGNLKTVVLSKMELFSQ